MPSPNLYENMPLYARMADEQGTLRHVCEAIQPFFDDLQIILEAQARFYDPRQIPEAFLDWFGQWVGLGTSGDLWLGLGLNPDWSADHKRYVIQQAWRYWQIKGTQAGIKTAYDLWLQWPLAQQRILFFQPWGDRPTQHPPGWWTYATPFGSQLLRTVKEQVRLGSGDSPGQYQPPYNRLVQPSWQWGYNRVWTDRQLMQQPMEVLSGRRSHMGPRNLWQYIDASAAEWRNIFPDIHDLQGEILDLRVAPVIFGWLGGDGPVIDFPMEESVAGQEQRTIREMGINGFQYTHLFPFNASISSSREETTSTSTSFGYWPGFSYRNSFGQKPGAGGTFFEEVRTQSWVVNDWAGSFAEPWPFARYFDQFTSEIVEPTTVETLEGGTWAEAARYDTVWGTGRNWYAPPQVITTAETEITLVGTGHRWYHRPQQVEVVTQVPIPAGERMRAPLWWYKNYATQVITTTTTVTESRIECIPGVQADIKVSEEVSTETITDISPGNQGWELDPGQSEIATTAISFRGVWQGFSYYDWLARGRQGQPFSIETSEIDLSGLTPIETSAVEGFDVIEFLISKAQGSITPKDLWYAPPRYSTTVTQEAIAPFYRMTLPVRVFNYRSQFNRGLPWYYPGRISSRIETQITDITQRVTLCNAVESWTDYTLEFLRDVVVTLPPDELGLLGQFPDLATLANPQQWQVMLETTEDLILLKPQTFLWQSKDGATRAHQYSESTPVILIEAVLESSGRYLTDMSLALNNTVLHHQTFSPALALDSRGAFGFRFRVVTSQVLAQAS